LRACFFDGAGIQAECVFGRRLLSGYKMISAAGGAGFIGFRLLAGREVAP
jgi:hypothetical protein